MSPPNYLYSQKNVNITNNNWDMFDQCMEQRKKESMDDFNVNDYLDFIESEWDSVALDDWDEGLANDVSDFLIDDNNNEEEHTQSDAQLQNEQIHNNNTSVTEGHTTSEDTESPTQDLLTHQEEVLHQEDTTQGGEAQGG